MINFIPHARRTLPGLIAAWLVLFACSWAQAVDVTLAWDPNPPGDQVSYYRVHYGTSSLGYTTSISVGIATTYLVRNLSSQAVYYFAVTAVNSSGIESGYSNEVRYPQAPADSTPPTITAVSHTAVTSSTATIRWTTNEASDTQVAYGTTAAYGSTTALDTIRVISHTVVVTGLAPSTTYHYQARSRDAAGNRGVSTDFSFTTAGSQPPAGSPCDVNSDGRADIGDIQLLMSVVGGLQNCTGNCDANRDGRVDIGDIQLLMSVVGGLRSCQ